MEVKAKIYSVVLSKAVTIVIMASLSVSIGRYEIRTVKSSWSWQWIFSIRLKS